MAYAIRREGAWAEIFGGFKALIEVNGELDDVSFPANWLELVSEEERAAVGAFEIEEPEPAPASLRVIGSVIEGEDLPRRVWLTEAIPLGELRADALARIASRRWSRQQIMLWNGNAVPSDDTTLGRIMATVKLAEIQGKAPGDIVAQWKFAPGFQTPVTFAQAIDYGVTIGAHYQACYSREAELAAIVIAPGASAEAILAAAETEWEAPPA